MVFAVFILKLVQVFNKVTRYLRCLKIESTNLFYVHVYLVVVLDDRPHRWHHGFFWNNKLGIYRSSFFFNYRSSFFFNYWRNRFFFNYWRNRFFFNYLTTNFFVSSLNNRRKSILQFFLGHGSNRLFIACYEKRLCVFSHSLGTRWRRLSSKCSINFINLCRRDGVIPPVYRVF